MSFDIVQGVLASPLAAAGTLTLAYPTGRSKGDYTGGAGHKVVFGGNNELTAPTAFTLTFNANASGITYTHGSGQSTIPAGTRYTVQLGRGGKDDKDALPATIPARMVPVSVFRIDLGAPNVADADGVAASQSVAAAANFLLNGALADDFVTGRMIFDVPRNVVASWTNASVLTIIGKDEYGETMIEVSASGTSHTGKKAFKEITSISSSASITSATVGTGDVLGLPVFLPALSDVIGELLDGVNVAPSSRVFLPFEFTGTQLDTPTPMELVSPVKGRIAGARATVVTAGTTGGDITFEVDNIAVDGLTISIANGAAAGTRYADVPSSPTHVSTAVAIGSRIEVIPAAAFNASGPITGMVEIEAENALGTLVVGNNSAAQSGTSGDVRGTYDPVLACDGARGFSLLVALADPSYRGEAQYAG